MFQIRQRFVDLIVAIAFCDETLELDAAELRHLENLLDVVGLAARNTGNRNFPRDEIAAANRKWSATQAADDRRRAAWTRRLDDLIGSLGIADRLEGLVDPAVG